MRKFVKIFALVAVAAVSAMSCTEDVADNTITPSTSEGVTLYATTPGEQTTTKVTFTDNDADGIDLSWEEGDTFDLYETETYNYLCTFVCTDAEAGTFTCEEITYLSPMTYDAYYNELFADISEQDGDKIANLDAACQMKATFFYDEETTTSISFEHTMAIMTFKFESEERPAKLVFENGDDVYTVTYSEIRPDESGIYTSHIMIDPCEATTRTLTFTLYDNEGTAYDIRTVESSKAYEVGKRYTASVSDLGDLWSYYAADDFGGGDGTEETPYLISTAEQFARLAVKVNSGTSYLNKYFEMTADIDLAAHEWVAIGTSSSSPFKGTFEGGNFAISNLYINQESSNYQALFGYLYTGTIKNIGVASGSVTGSLYVGGVVGCSSSSSIINCYNYATVSSSSEYAGGVAGYANSSSVVNSYNSGKVSGSTYVGGVSGYINSNSSVVINSYNSGEVSGTTKNVGGVAGYLAYSSVVNSYNSGKVSGPSYVGGVSGCNYNSAAVTNSYNSGEVSGSTYVGGVVGHNPSGGTVTNCYYDNDVYSGKAMGSDANSSVTITTAMTTDDMKADSFAIELNNNAAAYNDGEPTVAACAWETPADGGYPTLDVEGVPSITLVANNIDFADDNFKAALLASSYNPDTDGDEEISYDEASAVTTISVTNKSISSMAELEYFTNLESLTCNRNSLEELDLSYNTALTYLSCYMNDLTELDLSHNTELTYLSCSDNSLTELDLSYKAELTDLDCSMNSLTELELSHNAELTILFCDDNSLTELDLSCNTALTSLSCAMNSLTELELSHNAELTILFCDNNRLTELDLSANTKLTEIYCPHNNLTTLDISMCPDINTVWFDGWAISQSGGVLTLYVSQDQWDNGITSDSLYDSGFSGTLTVTVVEVTD